MRNLKILMLISLSIAIFSSCQKEPSASFTASKPSAKVNEVIVFSNTSDDGDNYEWSFGDGVTSTLENPTHSFTSAGTFNVTLTAFSKNGKKDDDASIIITVIDTKLSIEVQNYQYPYEYIEGIEVEVYSTYNDWYDETNILGTGVTNSSGEVVFSGCETIQYYIGIWDWDISNDWYDNTDLGQYDLNYIRTSVLTSGTTNDFIAYVMYDSSLKGYKLVSIKKKDSSSYAIK
jgi:PKD repeat protein